MSEDKLCPICGSNEIGKGRQVGQGKMMPVNKVFSTGSDIIAEICTKCGHIVSMKVSSPEKFK